MLDIDSLCHSKIDLIYTALTHKAYNSHSLCAYTNFMPSMPSSHCDQHHYEHTMGVIRPPVQGDNVPQGTASSVFAY